MTVRRENAQTRRETGKHSREGPRRPWTGRWGTEWRARTSQQRIRVCSRSAHE